MTELTSELIFEMSISIAEMHTMGDGGKGGTIYMHYTGVGHDLSIAPVGSESGAGFYFRVAVRFETGAEQYAWLNRIVGIGVPQRPPSKEYHIGWRIYAVL